MLTCVYCGNEFEPRRKGHTLYCSIECNRKDPGKVTRWRRRLKLKAIEYKGGACFHCGYDKCPSALEFHHPHDDKEYGIGQNGRTRAWDKVKLELDKCELVCKNCHAEIHFDPDREL
jgi:hypothetical protein